MLHGHRWLPLGLTMGAMFDFAVAADVPTDPRAFFRYMIDRRTENGLKRIRNGPHRGPGILVYGGDMEDANIVWVMAAAYGAEWSKWHKNEDVRTEAFRLLDAVAEHRADGNWSGSKMRKVSSNAQFFGLHAFANAVYYWKETGDLPKEKLDAYLATLRASADRSIEINSDLWCKGEYANPEFYYLSGLAVTARLADEVRYMDAARASIRSYDDDVFPEGGVSYIMKTNAQPDYQAMVIKGAAQYYEMSQDPYGLEFLKRTLLYFTYAYEPAGLSDQLSPPFLKHYWMNYLLPGAPSILASLTGDGRSARVTEIAVQRAAEWVQGQKPGYMKKRPGKLFNYHHTTFCVLADRYWKDVTPTPLPTAFCRADDDILGARARSGDFSATITTRRISDTLAGCQITNSDPAIPLDSALGWVYFEHKDGDYKRKLGARKIWIPRRWHFMSRPDPTFHRTVSDGLVVVTSASESYSYYGWREPRESSKGTWRYVQTWAVAPEMLFGIHTFEAVGKGGDPKTGDFARVRFIFLPVTREMELAKEPLRMTGRVGRMRFDARVATRQGWEPGEIDGNRQPPQGLHWIQDYWHPRHLVINKTEPTWQPGDRLQFGCAFWPQREGRERKPPRFLVIGNDVLASVLQTERGATVVIANHGEADAAIRLPKGWPQEQTRIAPAASAVLHAPAGEQDDTVRDLMEANPGSKAF